MDLPARTRSAPLPARDPAPSWYDILQAAFGGLFPSDTQLESFMDRYERMP